MPRISSSSALTNNKYVSERELSDLMSGVCKVQGAWRSAQCEIEPSPLSSGGGVSAGGATQPRAKARGSAAALFG